MDTKKDTTYSNSTALTDANTVHEFHYFAFVLKRTEKLSSALYMVTSLISDTEPLKWKLRTDSVSLMSDMTSSRSRAISERTQLLSKTLDVIPAIVSFLEIARAGGLVSDMNADILVREYTALIDFIREKTIKGEAEEFVLNIFQEKESFEQISGGDYKGHKGQGNVFYNKHGLNHKHNGSPFLQGSAAPSSLKDNNKKTNPVSGSTVVADKKERRKTILELIKKKKEVTIKDISSVISDCSEKTIQRELIALVKDNVLKKEGERRWSKYSLAE